MFKNLATWLRKHIVVILIVFMFSLIPFSRSFSEENVFVINNVKVQGVIDVNFSRNKYIDKAFLVSFDALMSRILLSDDLTKISKIKLNKIKNLIDGFQILEETYQKNEYKAIFKIFYNDNKIKKLLAKKNISFSQPKNISAVFFPVLIVNDELQNFDENYFYNQWTNIEIKNKLINFILPIQDLEDISKIKEMKNRIEEFNVGNLVNKYNVKDHVFVLLDYRNELLNIYLKTNFNGNETSKNISYKLSNIKDEKKLSHIALVKQNRLSVMPIDFPSWKLICKMGKLIT